MNYHERAHIKQASPIKQNGRINQNSVEYITFSERFNRLPILRARRRTRVGEIPMRTEKLYASHPLTARFDSFRQNTDGLIKHLEYIYHSVKVLNGHDPKQNQTSTSCSTYHSYNNYVSHRFANLHSTRKHLDSLFKRKHFISSRLQHAGACQDCDRGKRVVNIFTLVV